MKKWLLLVPLLGLSLFCSGQAVTTLDQNCNVWGAAPATPQCGGSSSAASGTQLFFPDIRGTITNQFEVVVQGTAPATLTVTVVGCMRGGTCSSTLASSSGTASQILTPAVGSLNVYDKYGITVSWTGGDATTRFVVNRTGTVAKLSGGAVPAGATNVIQKNGGGSSFAASSITDNGTTVSTAEPFQSSGAASGTCASATNGYFVPISGASGITTFGASSLDICANGTRALQLFSTAVGTEGAVNLGFFGGKGQHYFTQAANNDMAGVASGTTTTATVTFTTAYTSTPACVVTPTTAGVTSFIITSQANTGFTITYAPSGSTNFNYVCIGNPT